MTTADPLFAHQWAIDSRHAAMLHAVVDLCQPQSVLEIGSFQGASSRAFLRAPSVWLCEPYPTPELRKLERENCNVTVYPFFSSNPVVRALRPEMVFIDGDHGEAAIEDMRWAMGFAKIIAIHDVFGSIPVQPWGRGSAQAGAMLLASEAFALVLRDHKPREGERTERGLMVGFRDMPECVAHLLDCWDRLAS